MAKEPDERDLDVTDERIAKLGPAAMPMIDFAAACTRIAWNLIHEQGITVDVLDVNKTIAVAEACGKDPHLHLAARSTRTPLDHEQLTKKLGECAELSTQSDRDACEKQACEDAESVRTRPIFIPQTTEHADAIRFNEAFDQIIIAKRITHAGRENVADKLLSALFNTLEAARFETILPFVKHFIYPRVCRTFHDARDATAMLDPTHSYGGMTPVERFLKQTKAHLNKLLDAAEPQ